MSSNTSKNIIFKTLVDDVALPLYPKTSVNQIQIDDDHGLSDMLVTMCNTISDNTNRITSIENKSPELPTNVKQLLINLFAGAAYGNKKMAPSFEALCNEWGLTPSDDISDNLVNILYNLEAPVTFDPSKRQYIDTGIRLFENITDEKFTIMIDFSNGENASISSTDHGTVMHCMRESQPWPGTAITVMANSGNVLMATYNNKQVLTKTASSTAFAGRNTKAVICFKGPQMRVVCPTAGAVGTSEGESLAETKLDTGWFYVSGMKTTIDNTLILGAYKETNGTMGRYFNGTINSFKVYSGICSNDMIQEFLNMGVPSEDTRPVIFTTPKYKLDRPKVFVPENGDYIDTGIKLFENITNLAYTICIQGITGANLDKTVADKYALIHCMEETNPYPGLVVAVWPNNVYGNNVYESTVWTCQPNIDESKAEEFKLLIILNGNKIRMIYGNKNHHGDTYNVLDSGQVYIGGMTTTVDKTLLFGAYHQSDNTLGRFWDGTLNRAEVYKESFTDKQIFAWMSDWTYNQ